jgi:hypothetical protein
MKEARRQEQERRVKEKQALQKVSFLLPFFLIFMSDDLFSWIVGDSKQVNKMK